MENSTVTGNVRRAMTKVMVDEVLRMMDSCESETFSPEEIVAHLSRFMANPPAEKVEKIINDDAIGLENKKRFWSFGNVSCRSGELLLRDISDSDKDYYLRLQQEYSPLRSFFKMSAIVKKVGVTIPIIHL